MIEKTIKTYKYEELDENAKQKVLEKHSDINVDYDWWDFLYEDISRVGEILGIDIKQKSVKLMNGSYRQYPCIWFSGFYHQSQGSSFDAEYAYAKGCIKKIIEYAPLDKDLHDIATRLFLVQSDNFFQLTASISSYRDTSIKVDVERNDYKNLANGTEEIFEEIMNDFNSWIFKRLRNEYEYLTSEEAIIDTIKANDYDFDEDGNIA